LRLVLIFASSDKSKNLLRKTARIPALPTLTLILLSGTRKCYPAAVSAVRRWLPENSKSDLKNSSFRIARARP